MVSFCASTGVLPTVNWLCRIESVRGEREEDVLVTPPSPLLSFSIFPFLSVYLEIYYRGGIIHPPAWVENNKSSQQASHQKLLTRVGFGEVTASISCQVGIFVPNLHLVRLTSSLDPMVLGTRSLALTA